MEWQPIETAPKDGTPVILLREGKSVVAYWGGQYGSRWCMDEWIAAYGLDQHPTHWLPLPDPPRTGRQ